jgi:ankyrin repeat protein
MNDHLVNRPQNLFDYFCEHNDVNMLKILMNTYPKSININMNYNYAFFIACEYEHIEIVKYLLMLDNNISISYGCHTLFKIICESGNVNILKYLIPVLKSYDANIGFKIAHRHGNIDVIKYLWDIDSDKINLHENNEYYFYSACANGHYEMVQTLLFLKNNNININVNNECSFKYACMFNHLEIVKFLLKLPNNNINVNIDNDIVFFESCKRGNIDIIKYLLHINNDININHLNDRSFRYACMFNHTEVIKYLLLFENNNINIDINEQFQVLCKKDNTDAISFLLENFEERIDIYSNNDQAFYEACERGSIDVIDTLQKYDRKNKYFLECENNKIIKWNINEKLEFKIINKEIEECPICMENVCVIISDCEHQLCQKCFRHMKSIKVCHMCRNNINNFFYIKN